MNRRVPDDLRVRPMRWPRKAQPRAWTPETIVAALRAFVAAGGIPAAVELRRAHRSLYVAMIAMGGIDHVRRVAGIAAPLRALPRTAVAVRVEPERKQGAGAAKARVRVVRAAAVPWLRDPRGRVYSVARWKSAVGFRVLFQPRDGMLWSTFLAEGVPLTLRCDVTREVFLCAVGQREGAYQLVLVDAEGDQVGDAPAVIFLAPV